jgi:(2Fe-2S) ferredoxin
VNYPFQKHILICDGARCENSDRGKDGGDGIRDRLKDLNKKLGRKPTVRVCAVSCLDLCDHGPNLLVWPEGTVYSHLDRESAERVYAAIMGDGPPAADKVLEEGAQLGNHTGK